MAAHANDDTARQFLQQPGFHPALAVLRHTRWMWLLVLLPIILRLRSAQEDTPASDNRAK